MHTESGSLLHWQIKSFLSFSLFISINLRTNCMLIEQVFHFYVLYLFQINALIRYWSFYFASYLFYSWIRFLFYFILLDSIPSLKQFHFLQLGWVRKLIENVLNVDASSILFSYICVITRFAFCINEFGMMMLL